MNKSESGYCLIITRSFNTDIPFILEIYDSTIKAWTSCRCMGLWRHEDNKSHGLFLMGCQYQKIDQDLIWINKDKNINVPSPNDYSFIKQTRFFQAIDRDG